MIEIHNHQTSRLQQTQDILQEDATCNEIEAIPQDQSAEPRIRPKRLADYTGQEELKRQLQVSLESAKKRQKAMDHIIFYGPPGLGKTTLAQIIAEELETPLQQIAAPQLSNRFDFVTILSSQAARGVLFIDEIHRLPKVLCEILYSVMEDFRLDIPVGKGAGARIMQLDLQAFTLIGATTHLSALPKPLIDRFGMHFALQLYSPPEMKQIVARSAGLYEIDLNPVCCETIVKASRGVPRIANRFVRRLREYIDVFPELGMQQQIKLMMEDNGVLANGLNLQDIQYLKSLWTNYQGGPVGVENIATSLGVEKSLLENIVEPFLIQEGYLKRTHRGRVALDKSREFIA